MLVMELGRKLPVDHLAFAPDARAVAAGCSAGVYLWREVGDGSRAARLNGPHIGGMVRFTADGRWLFSSGSQLTRFDTTTGLCSSKSLWSELHSPLDTSPTSSLVLFSQVVSINDSRTRFAMWKADDLSDAGKVWEQEVLGYGYLAPQFLAEGKRFARFALGWDPDVGQYQCHIHFYDVATGEQLTTTTVTANPPGEAILSSDVNQLALRGRTQIDLFRLDATDNNAHLRNDNKKHFTSIAFHPSGKYLAATSNDETVKLYDTLTACEARTFTWKLGRMRSIAFSPDGTLVAAGTNKGQVVVWDVDL